MARREDYELTDEQIKAVKCIDRAFKKARKLGVAFECLNTTIHAYSQKVFNDNAHDYEYSYSSRIEVPSYCFEAYCNAGSDDMLCFKKGVLD